MKRVEPGPNPLGWVPLALGVWLAIFGSYEVIERTLLCGADANLLHILHIVRGTGTSFLLAGVVAWYILRRRVAPPGSPLSLDGLRTIVAESEAYEFSTQAVWIIRLRWVAVAGVILTALVCKYLLGVISGFSSLALVLIAIAMVGYNLLFSALAPKDLGGIRVAFAQVFLDLASLTLMIYFTGGMQNPFFIFYIFHIVIAGILLRKSQTYFVAATACLLFCSMALLQELGVVPWYPLQLGAGTQAEIHLAWGWPYVGGILTAFVATALCTAYFTTTIMEKLRRRGLQILEASEILSQERAKMDDIVRSVGAGLLVLDLQDRVVWANEIARKWLGPEIAGMTCYQRLWQESSRCPSCPAVATAERGIPGTCERSALHHGKQKFFLISCSPIRTADGRVHQILELVQDITPMKEMEIQLLQAEKMVAVGQLATGIAHEINNPLAIVVSSAEILSEFVQSDAAALGERVEPLFRHLKRIEENVYRCKEIIENLLSFARREDEGFEEVEVCTLLDDTVQLVEGSARARGRQIIRAYRADGLTSLSERDERPMARQEGPVSSLILHRSRPRHIQQVFLNLLVNALDAADVGGCVTVSADREEPGVEVAIADTGQGIAPEHLERIFEPFFTTKPVGKGTGLGLYICHQIVESLHGKITVSSRPGAGAVFRVWLPSDAGTKNRD